MSRTRKSPPPALSGLIRQLPAGAWSMADRARFIEAFTRCLDLSIPLNDGIVFDPAMLMMEKVGTTDPAAVRGAHLSGAHAPDRPVVVEGEDGTPVSVEDIDDVVWVRSTGRGTHDVMMAANPVPIVLASIMFTEGVKGRALALERFADALGSVSQDVQP